MPGEPWAKANSAAQRSDERKADSVPSCIETRRGAERVARKTAGRPLGGRSLVLAVLDISSKEAFTATV
jgi:hypothetical protein